MSLFSKVGLAMIPSAYKTSKVYSVLPNDADGDFDFARNSTATRVNKDGLIESVGINVPRLNYPIVDGVVRDIPHLLLEPARENLITYSEDFSDPSWNNPNCDISPNQIIAPNGETTADKLIANSNNVAHYIEPPLLNYTGAVTQSIYAKKGEYRYLQFTVGFLSLINVIFDLEDGVITSSFGVVSSDITFLNGYYRCSATYQTSGNALPGFGIVTSPDAPRRQAFAGDNSSGLYIWGAQVELGSYATSYFPTSGGTQAQRTRAAETCGGAGTSEDFNSSEGVLFAEIAALADDGTDRWISVTAGASIANAVGISYNATPSSIRYYVRSGGVTQAGQIPTGYTQVDYIKMAVKYKTDDIAWWVNGIELFADFDGSTPVGLNVINFDNGTGSFPFYGKAKQTIAFREALTDAELETLTSWDSFTELATELDYKIHS